MNKADLVEAVSRKLGETKSSSSKVVEAVIEAIREGVDEHQKVAISGFGTFRKKYRRARTGINPSTKEPIEIKASTTVSFTPSAALKNGVEEPVNV